MCSKLFTPLILASVASEVVHATCEELLPRRKAETFENVGVLQASLNIDFICQC